MLKIDRSLTYLQCLYPHDRIVDAVAKVGAMFGGEVMQHLEFIRINGLMSASGIPVIRYTTPERSTRSSPATRSCGIMIANPHVVTLEDGSRYKRVDADQLGFKQQVDPMGLLNPGKMRSFVPQAGWQRGEMGAPIPLKTVAEAAPAKPATAPGAAAASARRHRQDLLQRRDRAHRRRSRHPAAASSSACWARPAAENRRC